MSALAGASPSLTPGTNRRCEVAIGNREDSQLSRGSQLSPATTRLLNPPRIISFGRVKCPRPGSRTRERFCAGVVLPVAVAIVCLMGQSAPGASSARAGGQGYGNPDAQILMTYSGHLHRRTAIGSKGTLRFGYVDVTLDWTATASFPSEATFQRGVPLHYTKLTGKITASGKGNPEPVVAPIVDCEATLSERTGVEQSTEDQRATTLYDLPTSRYRMSEYSPPLSAYMLQSTDTAPPGHDLCSLNSTITAAVGSEQWPGPAEGSPKYAKYAAAWNAYDTFPGGKGPFVNHFDNEWASDDGLDIAQITSTITATTDLSGAPALPAGPPVPDNLRRQIKAFYGGDIQPALAEAKPYCLNYLTGVGQFGLGVPLLGFGPYIGPTLVMSGAVLATINQPFCIATMQRLISDYRISKDPPDADVGKVATPAPVSSSVTLPNCARFSGVSTQATCARVEPVEKTLLLAAERLASVANAQAQTIDRYSAAVAGHDSAATGVQGKQLQALLALSKSDRAAEVAAGQQLAAILENAHLGWRFTAGDDGRAIDAVLSLLAKGGVSRNEIAPYAGRTLSAKSVDVLKNDRGL